MRRRLRDEQSLPKYWGSCTPPHPRADAPHGPPPSHTDKHPGLSSGEGRAAVRGRGLQGPRVPVVTLVQRFRVLGVQSRI